MRELERHNSERKKVRDTKRKRDEAKEINLGGETHRHTETETKRCREKERKSEVKHREGINKEESRRDRDRERHKILFFLFFRSLTFGKPLVVR